MATATDSKLHVPGLGKPLLPGLAPPNPAPARAAAAAEAAPPRAQPGLFARLLEYRRSLPSPGPYEALSKELKSVTTTNHLFDGARADMTKVLSPQDPAFQVTHAFSMGSTTVPPMYSFGAVYVGDKAFLQGTIDTDGSLQGRANFAWSAKNKTSLQSQIFNTPGHSMLQLEQEYLGNDFTANVKAVNPSLAECTGIYVGSYLQSVTPQLALGLETVYQRPTPESSETAASLVGKYTGKDFAATATVQSFGSMSLSYVQKVNEKVDVAAECQILAGGGRREAVTTVAGKFEFRQATFRGQLDSQGKLSAVLEEKLAPGFSFLLSGEMDHARCQHKFGFGIMLEA